MAEKERKEELEKNETQEQNTEMIPKAIRIKA